jgi:hypothetical protein
MSTIKQIHEIQIVAVGTSEHDTWQQGDEVVSWFTCDRWEVRFDGVFQRNMVCHDGSDDAEQMAHGYADGARNAFEQLGFRPEIVILDESTPRSEASLPGAVRSVPVCGDAAGVLLGSVPEMATVAAW